MDPFITQLNDTLMDTYRAISKVEESMMRSMSGSRLSVSEIHMLECIGAGGPGGRTVSDIAQDLEITPPSATAMIKKLERKGYLTKRPSTEDGRRVHVELTREGQRAQNAHRYFHRQMARSVAGILDEGERAALIKGLSKLDGFLRQKAQEALNKNEESGS